MLRGGAERAALLAALEGIDRLVLLGDLLELRHGPLRDALRDAEQLLREIAMTLGPDREVVVVPGNHDHRLLRPWSERRAAGEEPDPLGLESAVEWQPGEALAVIARRLEPARVRAAYPGVWLRDDVYATHGHYCDRHTTVPIVERLGAGVMALIAGEPEGGPGRAEDYDAVLGPMYAWVDMVAQSARSKLGADRGRTQVRAWSALTASDGRRSFRRRLLAAGFPVGVAALNCAGIGPLSPDLSGAELRRAALRAFQEVLRRLRVEAGHVIFGHTHRAGPLPGDDGAEWIAPDGTRLLNTGSWVHDPLFVGSSPSDSPYRPGFAAIVGDDRPPELVNLLDPA